MLPPRLKQIRDALNQKGYPKRTIEEDKLLEELEYLEGDRNVQEGVEKRAWADMTTPRPGACPTCGKPI